jgi:hypothetical protein
MRTGSYRAGGIVVAIVASFAAIAQQPYLSWNDEQREEFLRRGEVLRSRELGIGITNSLRLELEHDGVEHSAHFQSVNERALSRRTASGVEMHFADSYKFNIAAYRLDRLLGLNMIPVSIERPFRRESGAFTWWVDSVLMMEKDRFLKKISPPDQEDWNEQMYRVRIFNELVYNTDPNLGNVLITTDWQIKLIDFTRAFRPFRSLRRKKNLVKIDRRLLAALKDLNPADVETAMSGLLTGLELKGLLARRGLIVEFFEEKIREEGEAAVLY